MANSKGLNKSQSEFLALIAHQLRIPLSAIKWKTEMLLSEKNLTGNKREELKEIQQLGDGLVNLVDDLLRASKLESGEMEPNWQSSDLEKLIKETIKLLKPAADKKEIKINFKSEVETQEMKIDPILFVQAFRNILDNAISYSPKGSAVEVAITRKNSHFTISVHDEGFTIPKEEQKKIFTKFYRGVMAQQIKPEGTGLGLFIAKLAIGIIGGKISFESPTHYNSGATFYISIPVA